MKTTFQYDHYYQYEELKKNLEFFAGKYPDLCQLEVICVTPEKRNVYGVTVTNTKTGDALSKPAFHCDGNHHAGEVTGSMACMHLMDYLLSNYGSDPEITHLLDTMTFYFVPRLSPDGTEAWFTTPYTIRSSDRKHSDVKGGIREEDLDGDGVIRMMRIPTPYGAWKKDTENPASMKPRDPGDREGEFYDIYPEGYLEPFDGDENLKTRQTDLSLNFNRNYPFGWQPEERQPGAGKYPLSEPETHALADWIINHPNICCVATNHTSGGVILYPPGTKPSAQGNPDDIKAFIAIANMCKEEMGYEPLNIFDSFIADQANYDSGAFDDWCYQSQGIPAYTIEYWDLPKRCGAPYDYHKRAKETREEQMTRFNAMLKWIQENAPEDVIPWKAFDHPTFGKVEIGGFNYKFTVQNAPKHLLKEIMEQSTKFLIRYAKAAPQLVLEDLKAEKIGDQVYKVSVIAGNTGYLPTNLTDVTLNLKKDKPVTVTISGGELKLGKETEEIGSLSGYSRTASGPMYGNLSTRYNAPARKKITWVINAKPGTKITVKASHCKAGQAEASVTLA